MAAGERRVDEVADVRVARVHRQPVAVLDACAGRVDVGDVELGIDALANRFIARVTTSTLPVRSPLPNSVPSTRSAPAMHAELGGGDGACRGRCAGAATARRSRSRDVAVKPLDHVAVDVGRAHLDGGRQVEDDRAVGRRARDVHHRVADLDGELELGAGEALGRVLVADVGVARMRLLELAAQPRGVDRDVDDAGPVEAEHDPALQRRRRVVEVDDRLVARRGATRRCARSARSRHCVSTWIVTSSGIRSSSMSWRMKSKSGWLADGKPDLDLLEAHLHERVEHAPLARRVHRVDQRLVAVAQVDRAPQRRLRR